MITKEIVSFEDLLKSIEDNIRLRNDPTRASNQRRMIDNKLPLEAFLTEEETQKLKERYDYVMEMMKRYIPENAETDHIQDVYMEFGRFHDNGGYQMIAEGAVSDRTRPVGNEYNWHFRNTSQWLFAFGLLFDTRRRDFSIQA